MQSLDPRENPPPPGPPEPEPSQGNAFGVSALGIEFALGICVLGALGWWADGAFGWRDTFPVLLVAGILLGFAWGVWRLQRLLGGGRKPPQR